MHFATLTNTGDPQRFPHHVPRHIGLWRLETLVDALGGVQPLLLDLPWRWDKEGTGWVDWLGKVQHRIGESVTILMIHSSTLCLVSRLQFWWSILQPCVLSSKFSQKSWKSIFEAQFFKSVQSTRLAIWSIKMIPFEARKMLLSSQFQRAKNAASSIIFLNHTHFTPHTRLLPISSTAIVSQISTICENFIC